MDPSKHHATGKELGAGLSAAWRSVGAASIVDNTDWLKTAAIVLVAIDHFGHFFVDDDRWWSVFGRPAAPTFFFLMGYAQTRTVPLRWIGLGVILTLLNSWNANWTWVAPNILLSLTLIRIARPHVHALLQRFGWAAFAVFVGILVALLPVTENVVDYGAEGWLWALFGVCQRMYVDDKAGPKDESAGRTPPVTATPSHVNLMRLLACLVAALVYIWQEQLEYSFRQAHFATFIVVIGILSLGLCLFRRGPSTIQPPTRASAILRFLGHHTLEIYAIQLAGSELLVKLLPDLAP